MGLPVNAAQEDWKESPLAQLTGGFLGGLCLGGVPFAGLSQQLLDATGALPHRNPEARLGLALGQIVGGIIASGAGVAGDVGGGVLSLTGFGSLVGVPVIAASTVVAAGGVANVVSGVGGLLSLATTASVGGGEKRGPKTDPNAPHNAKVRSERDKLEAEGNTILAGGGGKEQLLKTEGGHRSGRRPDILYRTPAGDLRGRNVGRTNADGSPVKREVEALEDLNGPGKLPTDFVPYDR